MSRLRTPIAAFLLTVCSAVAPAQVVQTIGSGTAVTSANATADFESQAALNDNPYLENGLAFTRTNLTFNNNGCGYAGCAGHAGFTGFSGNYMYGVGTNGYFSMLATGGQAFRGLEFVAGTGFFSTSLTVQWQAFLGGSAVGSGAFAASAGDVVGFASAAGFDELRYTVVSGTNTAPAFDQVRAEFAGNVSPVPEPGTVALLATGLLALGGVASHRRRGVAG